MPKFKPITHIIYDMDGLLLDTEPLYTQVTESVLASYGKKFNWDLKSKVIGRPSIDSAAFLIKELDLPLTPQEYLDARYDILAKLFETAPAMPGAVKLTEHLFTNGIPQAVGTSSSTEVYEQKTVSHKPWFEKFHHIVTADHPDVKAGKPAPDIFLTAAKLMGAEPENCLVFEDAPAGKEAALNAGMQVVVVPDPNMAHSLYHDAQQILSSLEEFRPQDWGLPAY